ncbi:DUF3159 domain-containing protein [Micrococcus sp. EYE_162]|uniref:DUF3159 domain-containing protein n=1 Tax=unclassified Micrococcus TaxID=2620948 RepID=UPI00200307FD|nr:MULTISPECIES: DUF3159 domain-containing protein [unclassified Micrococcus]MCK6094933.1 DUF3159 domain-containing protein [Micrococcus sp. EYE_212]MCK6170880.1 DUF3159 domain-containing protein [Micrococcus sp. EYE_162]
MNRPATRRDPGAPDPAAALGRGARLDEHGRLDPLASVGGWRGIVEASLSTVVFMVGYVLTQQVWPSGVAAAGVAVLMGVVRLAQRQSPAQVLAGLVVVVLSVAVALTTGQARDYYLWGFITNAGYGLAFLVSILAGWPVVGLILGLVRGEGTAWRADPCRRRAYAAATWVMVAVFALRLGVQVPLYLADAATSLGVARLVMGLPLYALGLWLAWSVSAPSPGSPEEEPGPAGAAAVDPASSR